MDLKLSEIPINIKDLSLEVPERKTELPLGLTERDWNRFKGLLEHSRNEPNLDLYTSVATNMLLLAPSRKNQLSLGQEHFSIMYRHARETVLTPDPSSWQHLTLFLAKLKLLYPQNANQMDLNSLWPGMLNALKTDREQVDWQSSNADNQFFRFLEVAQAMKILVPEKESELELTEEVKRRCIRTGVKTLDEGEIYKFALLSFSSRILFPTESRIEPRREQFRVQEGSSAWSKMMVELAKLRRENLPPEADFGMFATLAAKMHALSAKELRITPNGLEIITGDSPKIPDMTKPSLPTLRKF
ncbi:hypothetical protein A2631_02230 [Candidatus Daviesbacteria bacterium RIFCSPHIGHO2_01_FULL_44_29]|uniref:Uncharacterized protein n=1 Tax=Candidatus Daviesbacteria bacterium RIFCSPHIGHO2_02_FULL_43_12 TaxID=1797776 RepID=A0A1F5KK74_9BACT|nr:MAG: hypothetical protein A2631_02230 [Candidatus Daviesbacteria bacterium RIFCSPHIGHO2_01_FULL_44_29]OGE41004.1 MAG: hypothetical protein A3E86_03725 [Candidatus Daviesbacteria bacterium RIFCSPHIGHO2_12_FULL_47_45]OGE41210.1 MAG: hypothetical protein A3D25_01625 [Candidatus Daviesbacteria bacterium RIFCSPHIGHO2_02_FULL_43_12]OGE69410.1 MAG: hypothetical protein A3B55_03365 [Candidatus Daviesbacteria bacterium RIFCSPLOWO2_01_FULL_43_15]